MDCLLPMAVFFSFKMKKKNLAISIDQTFLAPSEYENDDNNNQFEHKTEPLQSEESVEPNTNQSEITH